MTLDQAIATLSEFRMLRLGPELSEAIDVVVAAHPVPSEQIGINAGWSHSKQMVRAFGFDPGPL